MDQAAIELCTQVLKYQFSDPKFLKLALTHASVAPTRLQSNERMEFLGDAVLGLTVCNALYQSQSDLMEGEMTKIKSAVVSRQTCAAIAEEAGICALLRLGKGMPAFKELPPSIAAAVFESIIAAIYLDGGLEPARQFILSHVQKHIDQALRESHQRNYKSVLQQYSQRHGNSTPQYNLLDEKGPDHSKCFEVSVAINGRNFSSAWGKNKQAAEQQAAYRALNELGLLSEGDLPPESP